MSKSRKSFLLYFPVLHQGYLDWFRQYSDVREICLVGPKLISEVDYLRKDIRALSPNEAKKAIDGLKIFDSVQIVDSKADLIKLASEAELYMSNDDLSDHLIKEYLIDAEIQIFNPFLRWNRKNIKVDHEVEANSAVNKNKLPESVLKLMNDEALRSSDWWRRIGAVLADKSEVIISSYNKHIPTKFTPYIDGDMRMTLSRGADIELVGTQHAEARLLSSAAKLGIKTEGLTLYTSTFPCPTCAKFIASAGIAKLYYCEGYSMGNGLDALEAAEVELVKIIDCDSDSSSPEYRTYPEKPKLKS